jgi:predicted ATPase
MITNLRAQNFKSWKDTGDLRLAPLTGFFGTNSSGKSSVLQVLLMMKQTAESSDLNTVLKLAKDDPDDKRIYADLRSFRDIIHGHNTTLDLSLSLAWKDPVQALEAFTGNGSGPIRFDVEVRDEGGVTSLRSFCYSGNGATSEALPPVNSPVHFYSVRRPADDLRELGNSLEECLNSLIYLGPLRPEPEPSYGWSGNAPSSVGRRGEFAVQALIASRDKAPHVERQVVAWLAKLGLADEMSLQPIAQGREDYEVRIQQTAASARVLLPDVGFGVSQVLPVLVQCAYAKRGSILILEQPEMHLHPSAQSALADVLIEAVTKRNVQIIFESHSEHLLRRIQRRIAEEKFLARDTSIYFCEMENGESKATPLELTEDGYIKNWPHDFFGDEMADLVAMTEASIDRKTRK